MLALKAQEHHAVRTNNWTVNSRIALLKDMLFLTFKQGANKATSSSFSFSVYFANSSFSFSASLFSTVSGGFSSLYLAFDFVSFASAS
jgi:hypothetical protein